MFDLLRFIEFVHCFVYCSTEGMSEAQIVILKELSVIIYLMETGIENGEYYNVDLELTFSNPMIELEKAFNYSDALVLAKKIYNYIYYV